MLPNFTSMLSAWQWGLLGLVPPAIVALYFLKLKRRPLEVPSTYLWHKSIEDLHVNSLLQKLRRNLLLFLQLLVILLAIIALLGPSWRGNELVGERFIFLVDNSASMSSTDYAPTRLAVAKQLVSEKIEMLPSGAAAMIISFSDRARVEQQFTSNRQELKRRLELIKPSQRSTSLVEALQVASGLANPGRSAFENTDAQVAEALPAKLYILSDGKFPNPDDFSLGNLNRDQTPAEYIPLGGEQTPNVGIVAFSTGRNDEKPTQLQAFGRVENFGAEPVTMPVELYWDGRLIDAEETTVAAATSKEVVFDLAEFDAGVLELRLDHDDALLLDNRAWTTVNPPQPARVLLISPGNPPLKLALATESVARLCSLTEFPTAYLETDEYKQEAEGNAYDLIIYDRCTPKQMPTANTFFIGKLPPAGWKAGEEVTGPVILDTDRAHPLMNLVELFEVVINKSLSNLEPPPGADILIDSSNSGPLLAIAPRGAYRDLVLPFPLIDEDAWGTTWPLRPSFPVFMLNLLKHLGGGAEAFNSGSIRPGKAVMVRYETEQQARTVDIKKPSGEVVKVPLRENNSFDFSDTDQVGVYEIRSGNTPPQRLAVNLFDPRESDIRRVDFKIGNTELTATQVQGEARKEAWKALLLLAVAVLLLEWYIYNRRVYL